VAETPAALSNVGAFGVSFRLRCGGSAVVTDGCPDLCRAVCEHGACTATPRRTARLCREHDPSTKPGDDSKHGDTSDESDGGSDDDVSDGGGSFPRSSVTSPAAAALQKIAFAKIESDSKEDEVNSGGIPITCKAKEYQLAGVTPNKRSVHWELSMSSCGVPLSAIEHAKDHEGARAVTSQMGRLMLACLALSVAYSLSEAFDDGCHMLRHRLGLLALVACRPNDATRYLPDWVIIALVIIDLVIDVFHLRNHGRGQWCRKAQNPRDRAGFDRKNTQIVEQTWAWLQKFTSLVRYASEGFHRFFIMSILMLSAREHVISKPEKSARPVRPTKPHGSKRKSKLFSVGDVVILDESADEFQAWTVKEVPSVDNNDTYTLMALDDIQTKSIPTAQHHMLISRPWQLPRGLRFLPPASFAIFQQFDLNIVKNGEVEWRRILRSIKFRGVSSKVWLRFVVREQLQDWLATKLRKQTWPCNRSFVDAIEPWERAALGTNSPSNTSLFNAKYKGLRLHDVEKRPAFDEYDEHREILYVDWCSIDEQYVAHTIELDVAGSCIKARRRATEQPYAFDYRLVQFIRKSPYNIYASFSSDSACNEA
jgi:hypothetical protein